MPIVANDDARGCRGVAAIAPSSSPQGARHVVLGSMASWSPAPARRCMFIPMSNEILIVTEGSLDFRLGDDGGSSARATPYRSGRHAAWLHRDRRQQARLIGFMPKLGAFASAPIPRRRPAARGGSALRSGLI